MTLPLDAHARLCSLLDSHAVAYRVVEHPSEGRTADISAMRGNRIQQAIKSIVVQVRMSRSNNQYCLANVPGDRRVDLEAIRLHFLANSVAIAHRERAEALTGCEIGAIPPFTFNPHLLLLADPDVLLEDEVVFNAGRLDRSIFMRPSDYLRTARPELVAISALP